MQEGSVLTEEDANFVEERLLNRLLAEFPDEEPDPKGKPFHLIALLKRKIRKLELEKMYAEGNYKAKTVIEAEFKGTIAQLQEEVFKQRESNLKLKAMLDRLQLENDKLKEEMEPTRGKLKMSQSKTVEFRVVSRELIDLGWQVQTAVNDVNTLAENFRNVKRKLDDTLYES